MLTIKALLEAGYTVITPNAQKPAGYWDTNQAPYNTKDLRKWTESPDHDLVLALLAAIGEALTPIHVYLLKEHAISSFSSQSPVMSSFSPSLHVSFRGTKSSLLATIFLYSPWL